MTTETPTAQPTPAIPAPLRERFRELALKAARGDQKAEAELIQLEGQIADAERLERRREAAEQEAQRQGLLADQKKAERERNAKEKRHADFVDKRTGHLKEIEAATELLARAVLSALAVDREVWALALQLEWRPETRTASTITNYIATKLGRLGAGLGDMPTPQPALQGDLIRKE